MWPLILKSHLLFAAIPLIAFALEPNNPVTLCDRFLGDDDKAACVSKTEKDKSDWYASSACSLQEDDGNFLVCLDEIKDASYHPEAIQLCAEGPAISDASRLQCLKKIKNKDYSRVQIKKCAEFSKPEVIADCLGKAPSVTATSSLAPKGRKPAAKTHPVGFQPLELHR